MKTTHDGTVLDLQGIQKGKDPTFVIAGKGGSFGICKGVYGEAVGDPIWLNNEEAQAVANFIQWRLGVREVEMRVKLREATDV